MKMGIIKITRKYLFIKRLMALGLVIAHVALVCPVSNAMESANFKVNQSSVSSGGGKNSGVTTEIPYSSIAEPVVGNTESSGYKVAFGYINTIVSNPPVFRGAIPDANMRIMWDKGGPCSTTISLDTYFTRPDNSPLTYIVEGDSNALVSI